MGMSVGICSDLDSITEAEDLWKVDQNVRDSTHDFFSRRYSPKTDENTAWMSDSLPASLGENEDTVHTRANDDDDDDLVENLLLLKEGTMLEGRSSKVHRRQRVTGSSFLRETNNPPLARVDCEDGGSDKEIHNEKQKQASRSPAQRHETVHVSSPMKMATPQHKNQPLDGHDSADHYNIAIDTPENADDTSLERHLHIHTNLDRLHTHLHIYAQPHTHVHIHAV